MHIHDCWSSPAWGDASLAERAAAAAGDIDASLALARTLEPVARSFGAASWPVLSTLATLGSVDLTTARVVEPHLDAAAILAQAGEVGTHGTDEATWGVYAANPAGTSLTAVRGPGPEEGWRLTGTKPWCSLAHRVSHALVTARTDGGRQGLFAVGLRDARIDIDPGAWAARGLRDVTTSTLTFSDVPARPVGEPGWYLERPGFAWGGIGVAAVWFGGAAAVASALWAAARTRRPDQVALMHLGAADVALHGALTTLRAASQAIDAGDADGQHGSVLAARVRAQVARCAEEVLGTVGHALGPGPLALDPEHVARVADLTLYVRQHHAERDLAALGSMVVPPSVDSDGEPGR